MMMKLSEVSKRPKPLLDIKKMQKEKVPDGKI